MSDPLAPVPSTPTYVPPAPPPPPPPPPAAAPPGAPAQGTGPQGPIVQSSVTATVPAAGQAFKNYNENDPHYEDFMAPGPTPSGPADGAIQATPIPPAGEYPPGPPLATTLDAAKQGVDDAQKHLDDKTKELSVLLDQVGPAITKEQQDRITEEFWKKPENVKAREDLKTSQQHLADTISKYRGVIERNYVDHPDVGAAKAIGELIQKCGPAGGQVALQMSADIMASPEGQSKNLGDQVADNIIGPNFATIAASEIKGQGGDAAKGFASLQGKLEGLFNVHKGTSTVKTGLEKVDQLLNSTTRMAEALKEVPPPTPSKLTNLVKELGSSPLGRTVALTGFLSSGLSLGADLHSGDYLSAVKDLAETGSGGIEVLGTFNRLAESFGGESFAGAKVAPMLGAISGGIAAAQALGAYNNNHDKRELGIAAAQGVVIAGSIAAVVGTGGIAAIGLGVAALGSAVAYGLESAIKSDERAKQKDEYAQMLAEAGVTPPEYAHLLVTTDPAQLATLGHDLGLKPEDFKHLYERGFGNALLDSNNSNARANAAWLKELNDHTDPKPNIMDLLSGIADQHPNDIKGLETQLYVTTHTFHEIASANPDDPGGNPTVRSPIWWSQQIGLYGTAQHPYERARGVGSDPTYKLAAPTAQDWLQRSVPVLPNGETT